MKKILKEISGHSLLYMFGTMASMICSIFLLPLYTRFLTKADYGILEITDTIYALMIILLMNGLGQSIAKLFNDAPNATEQKSVFGTIFWSSIFLGLIWGCLLYIFREQVGKIAFGSTLYTNQVTASIFILAISPVGSIAVGYFNLIKKPKVFVIIGLARLFVSVTLNIIFVVHLRLGSLGMLLGELCTATLITVFIATYVGFKNGLPFKNRYLVQALKFGIPFIPAMIGATLMSRSDRYLIPKLCDLSAMGVYSMGFRFPSLISSMLIGSFGVIWNTSGVFDVAKSKDFAHVQARIATYFFTFFLLAQFFLAFMGPTILKILTTNEYTEAYLVIQILAVSFIIYSLHLFFYTGAVIKNKTWLLPIAFIVAALINIVLNTILLPIYGYIAAAGVSVVTNIVFVSILYALCNKIYPIPYEFKRMFTLLGFALVLLIANNILKIEFWILDAIKQFAFFMILPAYTLLGSFLKQDEIEEFSSLLGRINPFFSNYFLTIRHSIRSGFHAK